MSRHDDHFEFDTSWIFPIIMTVFFWPVGLYLLLKKYNETKNQANRTRNLISGGGLMALIGAVFNHVFLSVGGVVLIIASLFGHRGKQREGTRLETTYLSIIGDRPFVTIKELAKVTGRSKRTVMKDLQKMLDDNILPSTAYIDHSAKCLVLRSEEKRAADEEPIMAEVVNEPAQPKQRREGTRLETTYLSIIGDRPFVTIKELSKVTGRSERNVMKDLQKMLNDNVLPSTAYIDHSTKRLVLRPDEKRAADEEPIIAEVVNEPAQPKKKPAPQPKAEPAAQPEDPAAKEAAVLQETFDAKLREIRYWNDQIDDEIVSARIDDIESITANIFYLVREKPERASEIRTFMNYYLPTTLKLLKAYARLEKQAVAGENIKSSKQEIERILDKLTEGFRQQLDRLFQADAIDISSDIDVLETMMAKDGLLNELKIR